MACARPAAIDALLQSDNLGILVLTLGYLPAGWAIRTLWLWGQAERDRSAAQSEKIAAIAMSAAKAIQGNTATVHQMQHTLMMAVNQLERRRGLRGHETDRQSHDPN